MMQAGMLQPAKDTLAAAEAEAGPLGSDELRGGPDFLYMFFDLARLTEKTAGNVENLY